VSPAPDEDVARRYFDALNEHDLDAAEACWAPGSVNHLAPHGEFRVPVETRPFFEELFAAVPDYTYELLDVLAAEGRVTIRWRATGRFSGGPLRGLQANGTRLEFEGVDILRVEDGLICGNDAYWDEAESARAIGLLPARDSRMERLLVALFNARVAVTTRFRR
jgi:steroid delta-isomerase-like uncharacterized protein